MTAELIEVHWSELDAWRQCPHKHDLQYLRHLKPASVSPALAKGTLWHEVLELHYGTLQIAQRNGMALDPVKLAESVEAILEGQDDADIAELIRWMYEGHLEYYGLDPEWTIVATEQAYNVPLPDGRGRKSRFVLRFKVDLVVKWRSRLWLVDHKSGKDLPNDKALELDDQFGLYTWGLRQLGKNVFGAIHNAARTQRNVSKPQTLESRFMRTPLYRTDDELTTIAREAYQSFRVAHDRRAANERHTNSDTCQWRCPFTDGCLHGRKTSLAQELAFYEAAGFVVDPKPRY